ncbi:MULTISPECIES: hypothetical protein [unclassified Pantoea]|uniref:hypothetical protein n=1 Tax=unclassified Pantoea TaxID=2630326 RepID=UPI001CD71FFD|nr:MULTISPECIES: hypothetical protein [unclassified Pantoea]MCA1176108.1 hypothetical protein [Pantoea sp. alder69]MCA1249079.1 hypothetical protein [Pantoea sp. alder70]MCA1264846.1 hypothetical protein [Pantoea sp. alder81]
MSAAAKTKTYDVVSTSVRRMTKLHTPAGDIKFTSLMKLIYAYIWTFQENEGRGNDDPIHTNTDVIAWEMGVSEKAVIDALKALDAAKVVIKHTVKVRGNVNSSNYVAIPPASVVTLGVTPPSPGKRKVIKKSKISDEKVQLQAPQAELQAVTAATPATDALANQPAGQNPDLAPEPAPVVAGQPSGVEVDPERGSDAGTDDTDAMKPQEPKIFDEHGVITEAFINSLTGDVAPNRNADGTLQSFQYVYWVARHTLDERDSDTVRTREEYMAEAREWHIPSHLLSTPTPEPEYEEDPNF